MYRGTRLTPPILKRGTVIDKIMMSETLLRNLIGCLKGLESSLPCRNENLGLIITTKSFKNKNDVSIFIVFMNFIKSTRIIHEVDPLLLWLLIWNLIRPSPIKLQGARKWLKWGQLTQRVHFFGKRMIEPYFLLISKKRWGMKFQTNDINNSTYL